MTDRNDFEGRLRATFEAEAAALTSARTETVPDAATLVEPSVDGEPSTAREFLPLLAAALLMVVGIGAVVALNRPTDTETLVPVAAISTARPLVTATPEPEQPAASTVVDPSPEPTPTPPFPFGGTPVPTPLGEEPFIYVVQSGDLLSRIAVRFNVTLDALLAANPGLDPAVLFVGQELTIPLQRPPSGPPPGPTPTIPTPTIPTPAPAATRTRLADLPEASEYCHEGPAIGLRNDRNDVAFSFRQIPSGQCGIVPIGPVENGWLPAQMIGFGGRMLAGFVRIDGLAPGPGFVAPPYEPGIIERTWCVTEIFAPDTLNVRSGPSTAQPILGELVEDQCHIYRMEAPHPFDGWTWISAARPDGSQLRGWVSDRYLRPSLVPVDSATPLRTIMVRVESGPPLDLPDVSAFAFDDGTRLIGNPSPDGSLRIPVDLDPIGLSGSAQGITDGFCAFVGGIEGVDSDGYHVLRVFGLCI